jgi:hypothetical protein
MPASSLTELLNFEGNVEEAYRLWFADQSIELQKSQGQDTLADSLIAASFELGATTEHAMEISTGVFEYDQYVCTLNVNVQTRRHDEEGSQTTAVQSRHQELVALVRTWMNVSKAKGSALQTYLAYYEFQFLTPSGTSYDSDSGFDETTLTYNGQISILPTAWP